MSLSEHAEQVGVYIGSGIGGFEVIEREHKILLEQRPQPHLAVFHSVIIVNLASGYVSIRIGAKGPNSATATACTTSAHSIGDSFRLIQHGDADVMICGGSEACITPMGVGGFAAMRALSTRNDEPREGVAAVGSRARRICRRRRLRHPGSGRAGTRAATRAPILAEIVGYGMSADAHHITAPPEDGEGGFVSCAMRMRDARHRASSKCSM